VVIQKELLVGSNARGRALSWRAWLVVTVALRFKICHSRFSRYIPFYCVHEAVLHANGVCCMQGKASKDR
jgi:hypothetical protein